MIETTEAGGEDPAPEPAAASDRMPSGGQSIVTQRAITAPATVDRAARTVEVVWSTGARARNFVPALGLITEELEMSPNAVRMTFRLAALDVMRKTQLLRIQGGGGDLLSERQSAARRRLASALDLFGGADSAGGSCLWHVLGLECSLREWAMRQGWSGRPGHHVQAQGILLTALGVLAAHYGLQPRERAA